VKVAVLLGDGMADVPVAEFGGRTPLEMASTPNLDRLARLGDLGLAVTVPKGLPAGSDVANLSVFGYDPEKCYTGRAPLEAIAMNVRLGPEDAAYRLNLVNLGISLEDVRMNDFSAGHISTEEAGELIRTLQENLGDENFEFYPGVSYRHLLVWRSGKTDPATTAPHDIIGKSIAPYLPNGDGAMELLKLMTGSQMLLQNHPVNKARRKNEKAEANSIWLWGQGKAPKLDSYEARFGLNGGVVTAVDLLKGIAKAVGLKAPDIPGATGYIDTDYEAKAQAALNILKDGDFVFVHVEAPDEAGHSGKADDKIKAIADFDEKIVGPIVARIENSGEDFAILAMPDHPTPLHLRTHTDSHVPFALYSSQRPKGSKAYPGAAFSEAAAEASGLVAPKAHRLMDHILGKALLW